MPGSLWDRKWSRCACSFLSSVRARYYRHGKACLLPFYLLGIVPILRPTTPVPPVTAPVHSVSLFRWASSSQERGKVGEADWRQQIKPGRNFWRAEVGKDVSFSIATFISFSSELARTLCLSYNVLYALVAFCKEENLFRSGEVILGS